MFEKLSWGMYNEKRSLKEDFWKTKDRENSAGQVWIVKKYGSQKTGGEFCFL